MSNPAGADKTYDVTPLEREVIEWRANRRAELRLQYLKELHNPNAGVQGEQIFDAAMQRHYSANFALERLFKPTVVNWLWSMSLTFGAVGILCYFVKKDRDGKEHRYRTGQVSYKDRDWKFA